MHRFRYVVLPMVLSALLLVGIPTPSRLSGTPMRGDSNESDLPVSVIPNPNEGRFMVSADPALLAEGQVVVGLYDLTGQAVHQTVLSAARPRAFFDVPYIPKGIYYLQARAAHHTYQVAVIIR